MTTKHHPIYLRRIETIIEKKLQNAPIVSLQLVSTTERPMRILRFMMRTPISKNILTSVLYRILMRMAGVRFISVISSL